MSIIILATISMTQENK
ncbi:TPA: hypothetical protein ACGSEO_001765 [Escherichia coli]|nr:hypothetical protein [Escherichia coli]MDF9020894.1 hypothetical protein [Escherichia coli]